MEYVSFEGLRVDGRRANETRKVSIALNCVDDGFFDGSCRYALGNTVALATVRGPYEGRRRRGAGSGSGANGASGGDEASTCEIEATVSSSALSGEGGGFRKRGYGGGGDRKAKERGDLLAEVLTRATQTELLPRCGITVTVTILCDDGGALAASVNAAALAMCDAGIPMRGLLSAMSVGVLDGETLVDLNKTEERGRGVEVLVCAVGSALNERGTDGYGGGSDEDTYGMDDDDADAADDDDEEEEEMPVVVSVTLERGKTPMDTFDAMHDLALAGARVVARVARSALLRRTRSLAASRALEKF